MSVKEVCESAVATGIHDGELRLSARSTLYRAPALLTCCQLMFTVRSVACAVIHPGAGGRTVIVVDPERARLQDELSVAAVSW